MITKSLRLIDAESAQPPQLPMRIESEPIHVHEARIIAIQRLGKSWLLHPGYVFNPRHSHIPEVYAAARQTYLQDISRRAAADRASKDIYKRAQAVRSVLGTT